MKNRQIKNSRDNVHVFRIEFFQSFCVTLVLLQLKLRLEFFGTNKSRRFLKHLGSYFLVQVLQEPAGKGGLLELLLGNREEPVSEMAAGHSSCCVLATAATKQSSSNLW